MKTIEIRQYFQLCFVHWKSVSCGWLTAPLIVATGNKSLKDFNLSAVHNPKYLVKTDFINVIKAAIWPHVCAKLFALSGTKIF